MASLNIKTDSREKLIDITELINKAILKSEFNSGYVICSSPSPTAVISINCMNYSLNFEDDKEKEIIQHMRSEIDIDKLGVEAINKTSSDTILATEQILFKRNKLQLGKSDGVYFCDFEAPRNLKLSIKVLPLA